MSCSTTGQVRHAGIKLRAQVSQIVAWMDSLTTLLSTYLCGSVASHSDGRLGSKTGSQRSEPFPERCKLNGSGGTVPGRPIQLTLRHADHLRRSVRARCGETAPIGL